jgi:hypothetical protein
MTHFIRDVWSFWKETWRLDKVLFFAEAIGTFCGMTAAATMGLQTPNPDLPVIYAFYLASGMLLAYTSYIRRASWMVVLMSFYVLTTIIGIGKLF